MKYLLDSSFLVALFLEDDVNHDKVLSLFESFEKNKIMLYLLHRIIEETATVLTYKGNRKISNRFLDFIEKDIRFRIIENDHHEEISFYKKYITRNISFVDSSLVYQSNILDMNILTLDKELIKIARLFK